MEQNSDIIRELRSYADEIEAYTKRFVRGSMEIFLKSSDVAILKQKIMEVVEILNGAFGKPNDFSREVVLTINKDGTNFFGSPSLSAVESTAAVVRAASNTLARRPPVKAEPRNHSEDYIHQDRIAELRAIRDDRFDLSRLVRLCEEANVARQNDCLMSLAMVARAILDHVPPIFEKNNFNEVASSHGGRSFKDAMSHLNGGLRKVADSHLHLPIRSKESLPNYQQVNFSSGLDVLLSEVVRILS